MKTGACGAAPPGGNERPDLPEDHPHHDHHQDEVAAQEPGDGVGSGLDRREPGQDRIGGEARKDRQTDDHDADNSRQAGQARISVGLDVRQRHGLPRLCEPRFTDDKLLISKKPNLEALSGGQWPRIARTRPRGKAVALEVLWQEINNHRGKFATVALNLQILLLLSMY